MVIPFQGFLGGTYRMRSPRLGVEQCLNKIPVVAGAAGSKPPGPLVFINTPGSRLFGTAGNGPVRAIHYEDGRCFCISGTEAYQISAAGGATKLGDVAASQLPAQIAVNGSGGTQAMFSSGGSGYIWNWDTEVWAEITDSDFPDAVQAIAFSDGYFLAVGYQTRQVNYSALFNGISWAAADVFQKSQTTDHIRNLSVINKTIYLIGSKTIEPWKNTGDALVTFAPMQIIIEQGIDPFGGIAKVGQALAWIGHNEHGKGRAYWDVNLSPVPFSHPGVEDIWSTYGRTDDAVCWTMLYRGQLLFVVSFLTEQATWAANMTTNPPIWFEMGYLNPATGEQEAHLGRCHAFAFGGKHLVGSRIDGKIYELRADAYYDDLDVDNANGDPIRRVRRSPHVFVPQRSMTINRFGMRVDAGVANATGQGSDPQLMFKYSVDGGQTYSNELLMETGATGEYDTDVGINRLGQGRDWVFEVATSEPTDHAWHDASLDAEADAA